MNTNRVIIYAISRNPNMAQISSILEKVFLYSNKIMFYIDIGYQFLHVQYCDELKKLGVI